MTRCHEEVDGLCREEARGLGEEVTSCELDANGKKNNKKR